MSTHWNTRGRLALLAAPIVLTVLSATALGASPWATTSSGTGVAGATALGAPTASAAAGPGTSITISVTVKPASGPTPTSYRVDRISPVAASGVCAITATAGLGSCADASPTPTVTNAYAVFSRIGASWVASTSTSATAVAPAVASPSFSMTLSTSPVAGIAVTATVTAKTAGGATDLTYTGTHTLSWSGLSNSPNNTAPSYPVTSVTFTSGGSTTTLSVTFRAAGAASLNVSEASPARSGSVSTTVTPGAQDRYAITSAAVSGTASSSATLGPITVERQDSSGNPASPATSRNVTLASNSTGTTIFSATSGGAALDPSRITIPSGASSVNFFYGDTKAGTPTITTSGGLTITTQSQTS